MKKLILLKMDIITIKKFVEQVIKEKNIILQMKKQLAMK